MNRTFKSYTFIYFQLKMMAGALILILRMTLMMRYSIAYVHYRTWLTQTPTTNLNSFPLDLIIFQSVRRIFCKHSKFYFLWSKYNVIKLNILEKICTSPSKNICQPMSLVFFFILDSAIVVNFLFWLQINCILSTTTPYKINLYCEHMYKAYSGINCTHLMMKYSIASPII